MLPFTLGTTSKPKLNGRNWLVFSYGNKQYNYDGYLYEKVTHNSTYLRDDTYNIGHEANARTTCGMEI